MNFQGSKNILYTCLSGISCSDIERFTFFNYIWIEQEFVTVSLKNVLVVQERYTPLEAVTGTKVS
jgi:hypothetical protein